ncbi:MAG: hypothetical protein IPI55_09720 [Flavobacteriales bacterium]|nr:hypothetical protein [Flavobacteriales bacterium]
MRSILTPILLLCTCLAVGQSFEGTLLYVTDVEVAEKMQKMGMTKEALVERMKQDGSYSDTITVSYKHGNYHTLLNTLPASWNIYTAETNKIHAMQAGEAADVCAVTDASIDTEGAMLGKMPTVTKLDTIVMIDGAACNMVRVKWKSGTYDYYYDPTKLSVDAALFAKHVYDGWADFLKISNALPVRIVKTTKGMMTVTMTLVSAKKQPIADGLFAIPTLVAADDLDIVKLPNKKMMRIAR